jgi:hypothetical protein
MAVYCAGLRAGLYVRSTPYSFMYRTSGGFVHRIGEVWWRKGISLLVASVYLFSVFDREMGSQQGLNTEQREQ